MEIYFQILDRNLRDFLTPLLEHLPLRATLGETPPGLADSIVIYDAAVGKTRPGYELPSELAAAVLAGDRVGAEMRLIAFLKERVGEQEERAAAELIQAEQAERKLAEQLRAAKTARAGMESRMQALLAAFEQFDRHSPVHASGAAPAPVETPSEPAATAVPANQAFLISVQEIIKRHMESNDGVLTMDTLSASDRLFVDFGLDAACPSAARVKCAEQLKQSGSGRVLHLSEYLTLKFRDTFQLDELRNTETELEELGARQRALKDRLNQLQAKRREVFATAGLSVDSLLGELSDVQYRYLTLDSRRREQSLSAEDRRSFSDLEQRVRELSREIESTVQSAFAHKPDLLDSIHRLEQVIFRGLKDMYQTVEVEEPAKLKRLHELTDQYLGLSPRERIMKLAPYYEKLTQFAKLTTQRARQRAFRSHTPPPWPASARQVLEELERIERVDKTLFPERYVRRKGLPRILLLPGYGSGLFDWQEGLLVVSLYADNIRHALLAALAELRLDADDAKELINSYGTDIKENKGLGFVQLKTKFIEEYTKWMDREASGYRVMEKSLRAWFKRQIPLEGVHVEAD